MLKALLPYAIKSLPWRLRWLTGTAEFKTAPIASIARLIQWTLLEIAGRDAVVTTAEGRRMKTMTRNFTSLAIHLTGVDGGEFHAFLIKNFPKGGTFVDVGANIGVYTALASDLAGAAGKVIAIEALPGTYRYLADNVALNNLSNVVAVNCAVGSEAGELHMMSDSSNAGTSHVASSTESGVTVRVERVDDLLARHCIAKVDYMKIDVEGFELPVLQGARSTIQNNPGIVIQTELVEDHAQRYGFKLSDIAQLLSSYELKPFSVDADGIAHAISIADVGTQWDVLWMRADNEPKRS